MANRIAFSLAGNEENLAGQRGVQFQRTLQPRRQPQFRQEYQPEIDGAQCQRVMDRHGVILRGPTPEGKQVCIPRPRTGLPGLLLEEFLLRVAAPEQVHVGFSCPCFFAGLKPGGQLCEVPVQISLPVLL